MSRPFSPEEGRDSIAQGQNTSASPYRIDEEGKQVPLPGYWRQEPNSLPEVPTRLAVGDPRAMVYEVWLDGEKCSGVVFADRLSGHVLVGRPRYPFVAGAAFPSMMQVDYDLKHGHVEFRPLSPSFTTSTVKPSLVTEEEVRQRALTLRAKVTASLGAGVETRLPAFCSYSPLTSEQKESWGEQARQCEETLRQNLIATAQQQVEKTLASLEPRQQQIAQEMLTSMQQNLEAARLTTPVVAVIGDSLETRHAFVADVGQEITPMLLQTSPPEWKFYRSEILLEGIDPTTYDLLKYYVAGEEGEPKTEPEPDPVSTKPTYAPVPGIYHDKGQVIVLCELCQRCLTLRNGVENDHALVNTKTGECVHRACVEEENAK